MGVSNFSKLYTIIQKVENAKLFHLKGKLQGQGRFGILIAVNTV